VLQVAAVVTCSEHILLGLYLHKQATHLAVAHLITAEPKVPEVLLLALVITVAQRHLKVAVAVAALVA
jgi:hypothetical protein